MRFAAALLFAALALPTSAQVFKAKEALTVPGTTTNGVAVRPDGKVFLVIARQPGQNVPQIAEFEQGKLIPYPSAAWNSYKAGDDASQKFVHANALRFDTEGVLWVVDAGAEDIGKPYVKGGPKLVSIDTHTGKVKRVLALDDDSLKPTSYIDDVRFNDDHAYITDAGAPGLIAMHTPDGSFRRVLDGDPSTTAQRPVRAAGKQLSTAEGKPLMVHADQLEVSPDGSKLYYQPLCGPMSVIETQYLDEIDLSEAERHTHVQHFADTPCTGGTAIDASGNIYVTDVDGQQILRYTPMGVPTTLTQDKRIIWGDALWLSADGKLWIPDAQNSLSAGMNGGKNEQHLPGKVYTLEIGAKPPINDHR
ncbi:SMP-30/gluconolactonase/LRE family protein [Granulicella cerasi]|uniref:SMP-30/gluconolactonase/LRE family protein n=1 Tax=Granulicella cerasi TaxID=741063 RepID=A0ABW1ZB76_9BACT|nr:L-dopachrome tautomerase-related protein [Granulicella cerasi]